MDKTYTLFISHSWDPVSDLRNLRNLLESWGYFNVEFEEVPPHAPINFTNAAYVRTVLRNRIKQSDVVIGLAVLYASYSDWMRWEFDTAHELGKPILGVVPWGLLHISAVVSERADGIVNWNTESIVDAIRQLA